MSTTQRLACLFVLLVAACGSGDSPRGSNPGVALGPDGTCVPSCAGRACGDDGCGGTCGTCSVGACSTSGSCQAVPDCSGSTCTCPGALTVCPHVCADLDNDPENCGSCGYACPAGPSGSHDTCTAGKCAVVCDDAAKTVCTGYSQGDSGQPISVCADLESDPLHCGSCENYCYGPEGVVTSCTHGQCGEGCGSGKTLCTSDFDQACVDTKSDPSNCGTCGNICPTEGGTPSCTNGVCGQTCGTGETLCNGVCTDVKSDAMNCGACGTVCEDQMYGSGVCNMGSCGTSCQYGYPLCGSLCCGGSFGHCCSSSSGNYCLQPGYDCF